MRSVFHELLIAIVAVIVAVVAYWTARSKAPAQMSKEWVQPYIKEATGREVAELKNSFAAKTELDPLSAGITAVQTAVVEQSRQIRLELAEEMNKTREQVVKQVEEKVTEVAMAQIRAASITREEFERLRDRVERLLGAEELAERMELLGRLFDTADLRVVTWQCKVVRLLEGGLAPEAEEDVMVSSGIPLSSARSFLRKLTEFEIAEAKRVESYYLNQEYQWILTYVEDPDWLCSRLEDSVRKEKDYQKYIRDNVELVEKELKLIAEQYEVPSGRIDLFCRDVQGQDVCVELKYPTASTAVVGQLLKYRADLQRKSSDIVGVSEGVITTYGRTIRLVVVAPTVTERTRNILTSNGIEWREISIPETI